MARRTARPEPTRQIDLPAPTRACPECGGPLWAAYKTRRTAITLDRTVRLGLQSAAAAIASALASARLGGPKRRGGSSCPSMNSASTSSPRSAGSATPSTAASPRSMPS